MHAMQGIKLVPGCCLARRIDFFVLGYGGTAFVMFLMVMLELGGAKGRGGANGLLTFRYHHVEFSVTTCVGQIKAHYIV